MVPVLDEIVRYAQNCNGAVFGKAEGHFGVKAVVAVCCESVPTATQCQARQMEHCQLQYINASIDCLTLNRSCVIGTVTGDVIALVLQFD